MRFSLFNVGCVIKTKCTQLKKERVLHLLHYPFNIGGSVV